MCGMKTKNDSNKLKHLAIIPDGNRRWAKKHHLLSWHGHKRGAERIKEIIKEASQLNISYLTFWIASKDNLKKRDKLEVNFLYKLFADSFKQLTNSKHIHKNKVRVRILGEWRQIVPKRLNRTICGLMEKTKTYDKFNLTFLLAYDGIEEMTQALRNLIKKQPSEINYEIIKKSLLTSELPPVDLMIRTGGEPHNSAGFMMWHTAYSQYYFTPTYFPDFDKKELNKAVSDYFKRERRYGA